MVELDHVTFRTSNLLETRSFFTELFDLVEGPRPRAIQPIPGHWLYSAERPIVHLIGTAQRSGQLDGEMIDHIAFLRTGYEDFIERLVQRDLPYSCMSLVDLQEHRVFVRAPGGQLVEVVFRGQDARQAFQSYAPAD